VDFGPKVRNGSLPVFSVADEEEALELLTLCCETNIRHEFVARELVMEQTIENLQRFSDRLKFYHDKFLVTKGGCRCKNEKTRAKSRISNSSRVEAVPRLRS
jgi:hypothetical protein